MTLNREMIYTNFLILNDREIWREDQRTENENTSLKSNGATKLPSSVRPRIKMIRERIKTSSCRRLPAAFLGCYIAVNQDLGCDFQADFS